MNFLRTVGAWTAAGVAAGVICTVAYGVGRAVESVLSD